MASKRYEVVGKRKFRGHGKGETFEAELSPEQERRAIGAGHIKVAEKASGAKKEG